MVSKQIKEEISMILETLAEQHAIVDKYDSKIPQIEIDIILENIRKLYERYLILDKLNKKIPVSAVEPSEIQEKHYNKPVAVEEKLQIDVQKEEITGDVAKEKEKPQQQTEQEKLKLTEEETDIAKKRKNEKGKGPDLFSMTEKETIADKYKETTKSLNEKLSTEKKEKTLAEKIGKTSISNLHNAIGINDKFRFINDLFGGDFQQYNKTIEKLNSFEKFEEASAYLQELKEKFGWSEESETYQKLVDLVIRKYS